MAAKEQLTKRQAKHEMNRQRFCILCLKKDSRLKPFIKVTREGGVEKLLNVHFRYNANDICLPNGLCEGCRTKLYRVKNDTSKAIEIPDLSPFYVHKVHTRSRTVVPPDEPCDCVLCSTVRTPTMEKIDRVDKSQKMLQQSAPRKDLEILKLCSYCYSSIGPGRSHKCNQSTRVKNLSAIIQDSLSKREKDQIISTLLRNKVQEVGENQEIVLTSLVGKPMRVRVNSTTESGKSLLTVNDIKKIQSNFKFTQNQTLGVAAMIRASARKRKAIEPNLKDKLRADLHCLDQFFEAMSVDFKHIKGKKITNVQDNIVYCKDLPGFIDYVKEKRKVHQVHLKLGIDGGGGFLKVCLSIQTIVSDTSESERSRNKYKDGAAAKRFRDSGVKKLFVIGIASIQENYDNVNTLWSILRLKRFEATIATDLKLANILVGLMCHSSTYPCTYCVAKSGQLSDDAECRTIGGILENYSSWYEGGGATKTAKEYMNCINPPIISDNIDELILDLIPPPELHLMLGIVNTLFDHMLKEFNGETLAWENHCYVERETKRGSSFNGNACKKLLNNVDFLRSTCSLGCLKYVTVLDDFQSVVNACFGTVLDPNFTTYIRKFKESYLALDISVTPKAMRCSFTYHNFVLSTIRL